jgi:hypothetical protein
MTAKRDVGWSGALALEGLDVASCLFTFTGLGVFICLSSFCLRSLSLIPYCAMRGGGFHFMYYIIFPCQDIGDFYRSKALIDVYLYICICDYI